MRTLYLECGMGAAGDMLAAALLELLDEPDAFLAEVNALGLPGVAVAREPSVKCGVQGTHVSVRVHGAEEESEDVHDHDHPHGEASAQEAGAESAALRAQAHEYGRAVGPAPTDSRLHHEHEHDHEHTHEHEHDHDHDHDHDHEHEHEHHHEHHHDHDHGHTHSHSGMHEIGHLVEALPVSDRVKADVLAVYGLIAEAESHVHGVPISEIHFHEVGALDAVADITAVCMLMERLAPQEIVVSPVQTGFGKVRCAHGILPVPAPATAYLLRDVPITAGRFEGELCTPTGAALLKHFATRFAAMPVMRVSRIGYGMGKKDFPAANCLRAMLGETEGGTETVVQLSCNVDDMTAEELGFAMDRLFEAGALEVFTVPAGMKKNRPGTLLEVLCAPQDREKLVSAIFRHTATIGIREAELRRYTLDRRTETEETPLGPVRVKRADGYGTAREKYEYDDLARIARERDLSLREVREWIAAERKAKEL